MLAHQRMDPGVMMVSCRSMILAYYNIDNEDGSFTFMASSTGNTDLEKQHAGLIGKDVVGTLFVNYVHVAPREGGVSVTHVNSASPNGSIPGMVVKKMTQKQSEAMLMIEKHLRK